MQTMWNLWTELRNAVANADTCDAAMRELAASEAALHTRTCAQCGVRTATLGCEYCGKPVCESCTELVIFEQSDMEFDICLDCYDAMQKNRAADAPETAESDGAA